MQSKVIEQTFFQITLRTDRIVHLRRRGPEYRELVDVDNAYEQFLETVDRWRIDLKLAYRLGAGQDVRFGWLVDVRDAPAKRNDDAFEHKVRALRPTLLSRSPILCFLVKTAAGRMQLTRIGREAGFHVEDDENDALAWIREQLG